MKALAFAAAILAASSALAADAPHTVSAAPVRWLYISGTITAGTASYVETGVRKAEAEGASAVVIQLDTPGGLLSATWDLVETELNAKVPIVVWVGPRGAHAGSAGVFITLAANVAAMAPATRIGAAHPVGLGEPESDPAGLAPARGMTNGAAGCLTRPSNIRDRLVSRRLGQPAPVAPAGACADYG